MSQGVTRGPESTKNVPASRGVRAVGGAVKSSIKTKPKPKPKPKPVGY